MIRELKLDCSASNSGKRLDSFIVSASKELGEQEISRSQIQQLISAGQVKLNDAVCNKAAKIVEAGDCITLFLEFDKKTDALSHYELELDILYQDAQLLVINKPPGLSMHPGAGQKDKTLANAVSRLISDTDIFPAGNRPGIVHRLDKDTTGLVVIARTAQTHTSLSKQFADRSIQRTYQALVAVTPRANRLVQRKEEGSISTQIGRNPGNRIKQTVLESGGRKAVTHWSRVDLYTHAALIDVKLETGRTHQIRVHMSYIDSPIVGDPLYGNFDFLPAELQNKAKLFGRQALHARTLGFKHPVNDKELLFSAEPPEDMLSLIEEFRSFK